MLLPLIPSALTTCFYRPCGLAEVCVWLTLLFHCCNQHNSGQIHKQSASIWLAAVAVAASAAKTHVATAAALNWLLARIFSSVGHDMQSPHQAKLLAYCLLLSISTISGHHLEQLKSITSYDFPITSVLRFNWWQTVFNQIILTFCRPQRPRDTGMTSSYVTWHCHVIVLSWHRLTLDGNRNPWWYFCMIIHKPVSPSPIQMRCMLIYDHWSYVSTTSIMIGRWFSISMLTTIKTWHRSRAWARMHLAWWAH